MVGVENPTSYSLVEENGRTVVKAAAEGSASALVRSMRVNPTEFQVLVWRWKVMNILSGGSVLTDKNANCPARLYVTFDYDAGRLGLMDRLKYWSAKVIYGKAPPLRVLNYVWANTTSVGAAGENPRTDWIAIFVLESGSDKLGRWATERRNLRDDYVAAFKEEPGLITGFAIMTDTEHTGERAIAYYGDITLVK
jgi:hypothetical protein